jgi:type II secretion system protein N
VKRLLIAGVVLVFLVFGLWIIAVPESLLSGLITASFQGSPVSIQVFDLQKGLFYNVRVGQIVLKKAGATLLSVDNASGRLIFSSLLKLRPGITFHGDIAGGTVAGTMYLSKGRPDVDIVLKGAQIGGVPFLAQAGLNGRGVLSGEYRFLHTEGKLKFAVEDADMKTASFGGVPVPLDMFHTARGAMETKGSVLSVTSFAMEGKGVYARIRGKVIDNVLNLTMEVMPDASFARQNPVFSLIGRYEVSPGYYSIPIRGELPF